MPDTLTITRDWFAMLEALPDTSFRRVLSAAAHFAFDGAKPDGLTDAEKGMFKIMQSTIKSRDRHLRYYNKSKAKPSNSASNSASNLDEKSVQFGRSENDDSLFNIIDSHGNLKKYNTMDSFKNLKESVGKKDQNPNAPKRKIFVPPTLEEVRDYALERNSPVDPEEFFSYYSANGWIIGHGNKMKDWHKAFVYWERNLFNRARRRNSPPPRDYSGI
jgi:hypothetical protein